MDYQKKPPDFEESPSYKDHLLKSLADLNYILDIMTDKINPKESQVEELIKQIKICLHDIEREMKKSDRFQKPLPKTEIIIIEIDSIKMKMNKVPLKHKQILTDITEVLNYLQETLRDTKENAIFIEIDGRLSKSNIDNLSSCTWDYRDGEEALPELNEFQTMETNVYCFETTNDEQRSNCCAKQETGRPQDFYVAIKAANQTEDKILQAYVLHVNEGNWKLYDTHHKGKYVVFRAEKVNAFFILGTFIGRDFVVHPSGSLYIHETDRRVRLEFPKECVEKPEILKVTVFPVKVDEMKKRIATFPDQHKFLSVTKVLHVQGCDFTKKVTVHLPLENLVEQREDMDDEYLLFHIEGNEVTQFKNQYMKRQDGILVTKVDRFCSYVGLQVPKSKANSVDTMEVLVLANRMYPCKLLTFVDRISDKLVQVWCEVIKKENYKAHAKSHLEENPNQKKINNSISEDIFIKEQQRLRVDVTGNSSIGKSTLKTSLLITFIPAADGNHIFPTLSRILGIGVQPFTTIIYQADSMRRGILNMVDFDPWILPLPKRNHPRKVNIKKKAEEERRSMTNVLEEREETREFIYERGEMEEIRKIEERIKHIERIIQTFGDFPTARLAENTEAQMTGDLQAQHLISETKRHLYDNFEEFLEKYGIVDLKEIFFANGITNTKRFMLLEDIHMETDLHLNLGTRIELKHSQRDFLNLE